MINCLRFANPAEALGGLEAWRLEARCLRYPGIALVEFWRLWARFLGILWECWKCLRGVLGASWWYTGRVQGTIGKHWVWLKNWAPLGESFGAPWRVGGFVGFPANFWFK